jgi:hypothetical protein
MLRLAPSPPLPPVGASVSTQVENMINVVSMDQTI